VGMSSMERLTHRASPHPSPRGCIVRTGFAACHTRVRPVRAAHVLPELLPVLDAISQGQGPQLLADVASGVGVPCQLYKCGDEVHRSTLDLVLRGETIGPDWRTGLLLGLLGLYLCAPPGVLPGFFDYYILSKMRSRDSVYGKDDLVLGRKLAIGGFGTVYKGILKSISGKEIPVVIKQAKEFGQAEAYMNERMMRLPGAHVAEFITAFDEPKPPAPLLTRQSDGNKAAPAEDVVWLVWRFEGDNTLWNLMQSKEFPYNVEPLLLERQLRLPRGLERKAVTIRLIFRQLMEAVAAAHSTGIVHRDVKPQNCIISDRDKKVKLIDLGAAADLRVGINYQPSEFLLDPRYAPPQQYVMSKQTADPPPPPVAALLSPILWQMEHPDRFDMWSLGITLLQLAFPTLRNDDAIIAFNSSLKALKYDLDAWRAGEESKKGYPSMMPLLAEGFDILDLDDGAGWKLVCSLMVYKPVDRIYASEALLSPFFNSTGSSRGASLTGATAAAKGVIGGAMRAVNRAIDNPALSGLSTWVTGEDRGSLTEAQLNQALGRENVTPEVSRNSRKTIVWWEERQSGLRKEMERREGSQVTNGIPQRGASAPPRGRPSSNGNGATPIAVRGKANGNGNGNGVKPKVVANEQAASPLLGLGKIFGGSRKVKVVVPPPEPVKAPSLFNLRDFLAQRQKK